MQNIIEGRTTYHMGVSLIAGVFFLSLSYRLFRLQLNCVKRPIYVLILNLR